MTTTPAAPGVVSCGVLLYKRDDKDGTIKYLLGLIPQRTFWTVFKGMPESSQETPQETALREFREETGSGEDAPLTCIDPAAPVLHGRVGKKRLHIFLQEGSHISEDIFDMEKVTKIDSGYMQGQPEIVAIRWLSYQEAMEGTKAEGHAKIYNSQQSILQQAQKIISSSSMSS